MNRTLAALIMLLVLFATPAFARHDEFQAPRGPDAIQAP